MGRTKIRSSSFRPCVFAFLDVDLQLAVEEGALAQLDRLAAPLGLGGVRRGGGLPPEQPAAAQGRRHRHSAPSPGLPPPPESVDASQTQFEGHWQEYDDHDQVLVILVTPIRVSYQLMHAMSNVAMKTNTKAMLSQDEDSSELR